MPPPLLTLAILLASSLAPAVGQVPAALALSCSTTNLHFTGNADAFGSAVTGASAKIERINEALCTTSGATSFSSAWVAVVSFNGSGAGTWSIFQVGIDDCQNGACPANATNNVPYHFYAYGREAANGCTAVDPTATYVSSAPSGTRTFTINRLTDALGHVVYEAKISGSVVASRSTHDLETCWGEVDGYEILNEVWNVNDQNGGPDSNRQNFEDPLYHLATGGWQAITRTPGSGCDIHDQPANALCQWAADGSGRWWSWDTRY